LLGKQNHGTKQNYDVNKAAMSEVKCSTTRKSGSSEDGTKNTFTTQLSSTLMLVRLD